MKKLITIMTILLLATNCADSQKLKDKNKRLDALETAIPDLVAEGDKSDELTIAKLNTSYNQIWQTSNSFVNNFELDQLQLSDIDKISSAKHLEKQKLFLARFFVTDGVVKAATPVFSGDYMYFIDRAGFLYSISTITGTENWKNKIFLESDLYLPKISLYNGTIFLSTGKNKVAAIASKDGRMLWQVELSSIIISPVAVNRDSAFVITGDNKLYALSLVDGATLWVHSALNSDTAILGSAAPIVIGDRLVAPFASGEIYGLEASGVSAGKPIWRHDLTLIAGGVKKNTNAGDVVLSDIDAALVVKGDVVIASSNSGVISAINKNTGDRIWSRPVGTIVNFWATRNILYLIDNNNRLIMLSMKTGIIKVMRDLVATKENDSYIFTGLVLASGKLIASATNGFLFIIDPETGKTINQINLDMKLDSEPIIARGNLYFTSSRKYQDGIYQIKSFPNYK